MNSERTMLVFCTMRGKNLEIAKEAALDAGQKIREIYNSSNFEIEFKSDNSPLTKADKASHEVIISYLNDTPYPVLSEEGKSISYEERSRWSTYWLIDPLDGTKEFIKRNGEFTVNIALIEQGKPVLGVVYIPVTDVLYWGSEGDGAFKRVKAGKPVSLPEERDNGIFTVIASRSHLSEETQQFIDKLEELHPGLECQSSGSSLKLCRVAEGSADVYPRFAPTMEWDTAAADGVCRAAGCYVFNVESKNLLDYNKENLLNPWFLVTRDSQMKDLL